MLARVARRVQRSAPRCAFSSAAGGTTIDEDRTDSLYFTTRDHIKGREVLEEFGMVSAVAVRSKSVISDMYVALAGLVGGEASSYTSLMNETMAEAVHRVQYAARAQGATALINVRFDSNTTMNRLVFGMHCSVICYGTAVKCRPLPPAMKNTL
ncbi:hypothetical protein JG688_00004382 [Phytophthora aleatoria]|uniref:Uncharacterized protein n=1 Tax=Phytophthora aleatoria TaxID=2496075 RepID=A0A8J5MI20_9STRA|nr:hypothetical protein JG688_00004382 [Phytophthora aleatoria]